MWTWYLCITMILLSPILFWEQVFNTLRKMIKWFREHMAREYGYDKMITDVGPVAWWEYPLDLDNCSKEERG